MTAFMSMIRNMDTESFSGSQVTSTWVITIKMRDKDMELWSGVMEVDTLVTGKMESSTVLALCSFKMAQLELVFSSTIYLPFL